MKGACTAGTAFCVSYDAAGNVMQDSAHHYYYDGEDRLIQVDGTLGNCATATACYMYDANGRRVEKATATGAVNYVYDIAGHQAEVNASGGLTRAEVYAGGKHLATYVNGTTYFDHADWLGTERARHSSLARRVGENPHPSQTSLRMGHPGLKRHAMSLWLGTLALYFDLIIQNGIVGGADGDDAAYLKGFGDGSAQDLMRFAFELGAFLFRSPRKL
ncbi:MAG: hypothetical protein ACYC92_11420 [Candidatus Acidiferrales bacterium]